MEIVIVRGDHKPWGIDGHLYINRQRVCDTVEHPTKHLPSGIYTIASLSTEDCLWPSESSKSPLSDEIALIKVPFRHGDGALGLKNREIIVGKYLLQGVVTQSQPTYDRLYERLKKAFQRNTPVRLTIRG